MPRRITRYAGGLMAGLLFALAVPSTSQAAGQYCGPNGLPPGETSLAIYCIPGAGGEFLRVNRLFGPLAYFRMGDVAGSEIMAGDASTGYNGEYRNGQDSAPVGISDDLDTARKFTGAEGYGYANNIPAPNFNGEAPYGNYTLEAWVSPETADGAIAQFGRAGGLYLKDNKVYFRNGDDETTGVTISANKWWMVAGVKSGSSLTLYVQESLPTPTQWAPATASGSSTYRPEGSPTFYVGYTEFAFAPWFKGMIDEVLYFKRALSQSELATQFYADPAPAAASIQAAPKKLTRLGRARVVVQSLTQSLKHAKSQVRKLTRRGAAPRKIRAARGAVRGITQALVQARAKVRRLAAL